MWKEQLNNIQNVELYAIVGFAIFFVFFVLITAHTIRMDKDKTRNYGYLPLEDDIQNQVEKQKFTL